MIFGTSWQTTTADLALILFLVVSSAASQNVSEHGASAPATELAVAPSAAVFRPTPSASLEEWLKAQAGDDRLTATVLVYRFSDLSSLSVERGMSLLTAIERSGRRGRLLVQRGPTDEVAVVMAYDETAGMPLAELGE